MAQNIRVEIVPCKDKCDQLELFTVNNSDTTKLYEINQLLFRIDSSDYGNNMLLKYKGITFSLGKLDTVVRSILLEYNPKASIDCFVVNKVYGDAVQSRFDYSQICQELHIINLYNSEIPNIESRPIIRLRRKNKSY